MELKEKDQKQNKHRIERRKFTEEEDMTLIYLVNLFGETHWPLIAKSIEGRTARQCRERYKTYLAPDLSNGPWTKDEDELLKELVEEIGLKWAEIAKRFNGRSDNNVKNRWYTYHKPKSQKCIKRSQLKNSPTKHKKSIKENDYV